MPPKMCKEGCGRVAHAAHGGRCTSCAYRASPDAQGRRRWSCGYCGGKGHNVRTCPAADSERGQIALGRRFESGG